MFGKNCSIGGACTIRDILHFCKTIPTLKFYEVACEDSIPGKLKAYATNLLKQAKTEYRELFEEIHELTLDFAF